MADQQGVQVAGVGGAAETAGFDFGAVGAKADQVIERIYGGVSRKHGQQTDGRDRQRGIRTQPQERRETRGGHID